MHYKSHPNILLDVHVDSLLRYHRNFKSTDIDADLDIVEESILYHDWGKKNKFFQKRIGQIEKGKKGFRDSRRDKHAVLSSMKFLEAVSLTDKSYLMKLNIILGHHGSLRSFDSLVDDMYRYADDIDLLESYRSIEDLDDMSLRLKAIELEDFLYDVKDSWTIEDAVNIRKYFSQMVDADRISAMRESVYNHDDLIELSFHGEAEHYEKVKGLDKSNKLDMIRRDIKLNYEDLLKRKRGIYTLSLPTGLGKTITSAKIAEKNKSKVIYVVPYLTVADQTWEVFHDIYKHGIQTDYWDLLVKHDSRLNEKVYNRDVNDETLNVRDFITNWRSQITITTTVQFFETLLSLRSGSLRKVHNTYGSTILIDEPQAIPYEKWEFLKNIISYYAEEMNWKVIYLSATPPLMLDGTIKLVKNEEYIYSLLGRTEIEFVGSREGYQGIRDWVSDAWGYTKDKKQVLWLLNVEKHARKVFDYAVSLDLERKVVFISGKLPPIVRSFKIQKIKELMDKGDSVLVISTQVLEAGVDLDFDGIVRDLAPFPVLIQVAGRLNRRWNRPREKLYVMQLMEDTIYSDFEFRHTGHVLYQRNNIIKEEDYYIACKEYYSLCEEMPPSEVPSIWMDQFLHLRQTSFEMIESPDYQTAAICSNVIDFINDLSAENYIEMNNLTKRLTGYVYQDIYSVLEEISYLELSIEEGNASGSDLQDLKDLTRYISWFQTTCNYSDVEEYSILNKTFYMMDVPEEYIKY